MSDKNFVDTNIMVYAHDVDAGSKHEIAKGAMLRLWDDRTGRLSPQVLQEFYVTVTRKITKPLTRADARAVVADYAPWCVEIGADEVVSAFRIEDTAKISFWDAMICAAALKAGAVTILSEDLNNGQIIAGISIRNPFIAR